ncbi:MAG: uracil-DNA glycosylase [Nitrospirae bacterium]|nr:uracil-DNA glycosylase [Candidatus Troglogloeales bacterium]
MNAVVAWLNWYRDMGVDMIGRPQGSPSYVAHPHPTPPLEGEGALQKVREELGDCKRCKLCSTRTHIVFGSGNQKAALMFVGEGPGKDEDFQGLPFVGKAGELLTKMIVAMGLSREEVYIANIVKCRPPNNRPPQEDEIAACQPFLRKQIEAIAPQIICALGSFAAQTLLASQVRISDLRGKFHDLHGIKVLPTFHPAYLLRNPAEKKKVWEDLQKIMAELKGGTAIVR